MKRDPLIDSLLAEPSSTNKRWLVDREDALAPPPNASFSGPLLPERPCHADVFQGDIDDGYFIAALCAVAEARPDWIFELVRDDAPYVDVRFFVDDVERRAHVVRVSSVLATSTPTGRSPARSTWPYTPPSGRSGSATA